MVAEVFSKEILNATAVIPFATILSHKPNFDILAKNGEKYQGFQFCVSGENPLFSFSIEGKLIAVFVYKPNN